MKPSFTSDWFSQHIPLWESLLGPWRGKPDLHFLEVGSYEGRSACWLLKNILTHASARLTCIDLFAVGDDLLEISDRMQLHIAPSFDIGAAFDRNMHALNAEQKVIKLKGNSRELLRTLPLCSFDCIYIDGSHTSKSSLLDGMQSLDLLKAGGIIIFDDYAWNCFPESPLKNPKKGIDALLAFFGDELEVIHRDYQLIVRKIEKHKATS